MCDPILATLLKMRPNYSQSSRENATPSLPLTREKRVGYWVELLRHYQIFGKLLLPFIKLRRKRVRLPVPVG